MTEQAEEEIMTAAYFSDFMGDRGQEAERIRQITACLQTEACPQGERALQMDTCLQEERLQQTGDRLQEQAEEQLELLAVMSGDFFQNGCVAPVEKRQRIQKGLAAGASGVLEMSCFASLSSVGIFAFSAARLLDKLGSVQVLALETRAADLDQLTEIAYLLIVNDRQFQQRVASYKEQGRDFYQAQAKAVGERIPGGEEIMSCWENILAVECIKSLKLMYSNIRCVCVSCLERPGMFAEWETGREMGARLDDLLRYQLYYSEMQLSDIYGGYEHLTKQILALRDSYESFSSFCEQLAKGQALYDIRKYFLRLLCGINKSTIGIWRMYDFAPCVSLHVKEEARARRLAEHSKIQLLADPPRTGRAADQSAEGKADRAADQSAEPGKEWVWLPEGRGQLWLERSKEELLRLERRAEQICGLIRG